ncbi:MAG: DUF1554 domain-containing protein [Sandaracinaceae bacterium]|nr:DUF1554 domain-containing protein [Sandaracinaceae bacterium]
MTRTSSLAGHTRSFMMIFVLCAAGCGDGDASVPSDAAMADAGAPDFGATDASAADALMQDAQLSDAGVATDASMDAGVDTGFALRDNGEACHAGAECQTGNCVDTVCCDTECSGTCESCVAADTGLSDGQCAPVLATTDPADECDGMCATGFCSGSSPACEASPAETVCRASAGTCDVEEICNGLSLDCPENVFVAAASATCAPYQCTGTTPECRTSCLSNADCGARAVCLDSACVVGKRVFVTSMAFAGNLGGASGADALCNAAAASGGLIGTFAAWLGDATTSPSVRIAHASVPYYRMDGTTPRIICDDWSDLVDGIAVAVAMDEMGNPHANAHVWTGANDNGTANGAHCSNWTSSSTGDSGMHGNASAGATFSTWYGPTACNNFAHLYCFEQ